MKNIIYKITNKVNGKVYIGLTTQGLLQRQREHICRFNRGERDHKLYLAFRKHGLESFVFEEVCSALHEDYLKDLEIMLIAEYNSFNRGYNMTSGGDTVSLETRAKLSEALKGRKITWYDKILESRASNPNDRRQKHHLLKQGETELMVYNLTKFCKDNGLDIANLYHTRKTNKTHKGYSLLGSSTTSSFERRA